MKKFYFGLMALLFSAVGSLEGREVLLEGKASYFYPIDERFRKIYGGGGLYGAEASVSVWESPRYGTAWAWASGTYFSKKGHSIGLKTQTNIHMLPIGLGGKYSYRWKKADFYGGIGALFAHLETIDHSRFVIKKTHKWWFGGTAKVGGVVNLKQDLFFIDIFCDFSYLKMNFDHRKNGKVYPSNPDLSGLSIGGAVGFRFDPRRAVSRIKPSYDPY